MEKRLGEAANEAERRSKPCCARSNHGQDATPLWSGAWRHQQFQLARSRRGRARQLFRQSSRPRHRDVHRPKCGTRCEPPGAGLGIGPKIYEYLANKGVEIADFIEGRRACTNRDFHDPAVRKAAIGSLSYLQRFGKTAVDQDHLRHDRRTCRPGARARMAPFPPTSPGFTSSTGWRGRRWRPPASISCPASTIRCRATS